MNRVKFFDEVHDFQRFVRENIRLMGNYTIVSEQLTTRNNETGILDMLVVDNNEKRLVVLELKNEVTTDKNVWQPIRYYDLLRRGEDSLKELLLNVSHRFSYPINQIDLNPELVLVVPECNEQLLRTLSYFNDIDIKVIQLNRYVKGNTLLTNVEKFYPVSIFHKEDVVKVQNKSSKSWSFDEYIKNGISKDKIETAIRMSNIIEQMFKRKGYLFDIFFTETKATITKNGKVWGHLFVKQRPLDYKLTVSFRIDGHINVNDFSFYHFIDSYDVQKNRLKLTLTSTPTISLLEKYASL